MKADACARLAMNLADGPTIPYVLGGESKAGLDCQGLIEYVVRQLGGRMSYAGSNDMYRNACINILPVSASYLVPGMVLFIVKQDGKEPDKYKPDGLGNASHVGWYTGGKHEVVHASASAGKVAPSTLKNGWTHAGMLKAVDYEGGGEVHEPWAGRVSAPSGGTVNLRASPTTTATVLEKVRVGTLVEVLDSRSGWYQVRAEKLGWMMAEFVIGEDTAHPGSPEGLMESIERLTASIDRLINALERDLPFADTGKGRESHETP